MQFRLNKQSPVQCLAAAILVYFALWIAVPRAMFIPMLAGIIDRAIACSHGPVFIILNLAGAALFAAPIVAFMIVQLGIVYYLSSIKMNLKQAAAAVILFIIAIVGFMVLIVWQSGVPAKMHCWPSLRGMLFIVGIYPTLLRMPLFVCIILGAASIGRMISFGVKEKNIVLPVVLCAAWIDFWTVTVGPVSTMLQKAPEIVKAIAAPIPQAGAGQFVPSGMIGPGDFLFAGMVFAVCHNLGMRPARNFWFVFIAMTIGMLLVMGGALPYLPALIVLAIAVIAANWREFSLTRQEIAYVVIVGLVLVALLPLIWALVAPKHKAKPNTHRTTVIKTEQLQPTHAL